MILTVRDGSDGSLLFRVTSDGEGRFREEGEYVHPLTNPEYERLPMAMSDPKDKLSVGREDGDMWLWALAIAWDSNGYFYSELEGEPDFLQAETGVAP